MSRLSHIGLELPNEKNVWEKFLIVRYGNGETYTKDGIKKALSLFQQREGNGHGKVLMLITDGEPNPYDWIP